MLRYPSEAFGKRVAHAGFWAFALRVVERLFALVRTVVLARLLAPEDFGLFGIALLALSTLEMFSQTGIQRALIQQRSDIKAYLDTAWTVQVARGVLVAGLLFATAGPVATFFEEPQAVPLLQLIGLTTLIRGFTNIGVVYFQKELAFHREFAYRFGGTLVDVAVAITTALIWRNAMSLVVGLAAGHLMRVAASYVIHAYRPRLRFDRARAVEMYHYGKWVFGSSVVAFLALYGDDIFLGKVAGAVALGLYQMAFRFANLTATEVTNVIARVTFPAYAQLQDNAERLRRAFLQTLEGILAVTVPVTVGLLLLAPDFVQLVLGGGAWTPMTAALQLLAVAGLMRAVAATGGALFQAVGQPRLNFRMNVVRVAVIAAVIYPLTMRFSMEGTAVAVVLGLTATLPVWWRLSRRIVEARPAEMLRPAAPVLGCAAAMTAFLLGVLMLWEGVSWLRFGTALAGGVVVYGAGLLFCWRRYRAGPLRILHALRAS